MLIDYSYCNEAFVDGLNAFLNYTSPNSFRDEIKEGLIARRHRQKSVLEKHSIQRWAISELINLIIDNPYEPVEATTYKFALKLLYFEKTAINADVKKVFRIAADFIDKEVINLFRTREGIYP